MNKALEQYMKQVYNNNAFTGAHYIVGYREDGIVYMAIFSNFHFVELAKLTTGSRKAGHCLRYTQTNTAVTTLKARADYIIPLCTVAELEALAWCWNGTECKQANRGKAFERLVTEYFGQVWEDDSIPWWEGPDIEINGIGYQIKYDRCNFCNEKQISEAGLR